MRKNQLFYFLAAVCLALFITNAAAADDKVIVVPLIGNDSELKPIGLNDVLVRRLFFNSSTDIRDLFTTDANNAYVVTSMHVYFRGSYPATRQSVGVRTRTSSQLIRFWYVPNDEYSVIDFGSGYLFETNSTREWQIDVPFRGGYANGSANSIYVDFYGYRVSK